jgi:hypothetical protein
MVIVESLRVHFPQSDFKINSNQKKLRFLILFLNLKVNPTFNNPRSRLNYIDHVFKKFS